METNIDIYVSSEDGPAVVCCAESKTAHLIASYAWLEWKIANQYVALTFCDNESIRQTIAALQQLLAQVERREYDAQATQRTVPTAPKS